MKGISPFVATILLVGFTVAVGAIISTWFITFTRTQTAGVGTGAACTPTSVRIFSNATTTSSSALRVYIMNLRSDTSITVGSVTVICDGNRGTPTTGLPLPLPANAIGSVDVSVTGGGCTISNTRIQITANCTLGGSFTTECAPGTCGIY